MLTNTALNTGIKWGTFPPSLTGAQRYDADRWLRTGDFVPDGLQNPQHPSHCAISPTHQDPKVRDVPERVQPVQHTSSYMWEGELQHLSFFEQIDKK